MPTDFGLPEGCIAVEQAPIILDDGFFCKRVLHVQGHHPELERMFSFVRFLNGSGPLLTEITLSYSASKKGVAQKKEETDEFE